MKRMAVHRNGRRIAPVDEARLARHACGMDVVDRHPVILQPVLLIVGAIILGAGLLATALLVAGAAAAYLVERTTDHRLLAGA